MLPVVVRGGWRWRRHRLDEDAAEVAFAARELSCGPGHGHSLINRLDGDPLERHAVSVVLGLRVGELSLVGLERATDTANEPQSDADKER